MNIYNSLPYLAGYLLQGEPGLFMWFIHFANRPEIWKWICIIAVVISNISFTLYFLAGYYAENFLHLREKIFKIASKLERHSLNFPEPIIVVFMRFFFLIRNPIAVYLGIKKYKLWKFILYNFAGSILWISVWFFLFYSVQLEIHNILSIYSKALYISYIVFLFLWIIISLRWNRIKELLFKNG